MEDCQEKPGVNSGIPVGFKGLGGGCQGLEEGIRHKAKGIEEGTKAQRHRGIEEGGQIRRGF